MNKSAIKSKITRALRKGVNATTRDLRGLMPASLTAGKLYEAYSLALVCAELKSKEACTLTLVGSSKITLKSSPGPINSKYPHIKVEKNGVHFANIWTDIEFVSLSACTTPKAHLNKGDYHEMDIVLVPSSVLGRPQHNEILIAVESKNTGYQKNLLREILGVRRELSYLVDPISTVFKTWPNAQVPADPPSCLLVYSTDPAIHKYSSPGNFFGINFYHASL